MKRSLKFLAVLAIVSMVVAMGLPAFAKGGKGKGKGQDRGGKKAVGTVVAYEPTANLLTASMKDGSTFSGTVAEDAKVKLDHRGNNGENKRKKPSNGDETDILPGAEILKLKVKCDEVTKLKLRAGTGTEPVEEPDGEDDSDDSDDDTDDSDDDESDDSDEDDSDEDDTDDTDDDGGLLDPLVRTATEDEGDDEEEVEVEEPETDDDSDDADDDSDDCDADEDEDESDDDSDDLDEDLDDELDGDDDSDDDSDDADDSDDDSDDSDDDDSDEGDDDLVDCVVTDLEDCLS